MTSNPKLNAERGQVTRFELSTIRLFAVGRLFYQSVLLCCPSEAELCYRYALGARMTDGVSRKVSWQEVFSSS
jgi:hypothetical protein